MEDKEFVPGKNLPPGACLRREDACRLLCPRTAGMMRITSTMRRDIMGVHKYCRRKGI